MLLIMEVVIVVVMLLGDEGGGQFSEKPTYNITVLYGCPIFSPSGNTSSRP